MQGERSDEIRAWFGFAILVLFVLVYSAVALARQPLPPQSAAIVDGKRFGLTLDKRQQIYRDVLAAEPSSRVAAAKLDELAVWNRNHDDYFHQQEANHVHGIASRHRIPVWEVYWILDEGFHAHWPPPPGVTIRMDDSPLMRTTTPYAQRPIVVPAP